MMLRLPDMMGIVFSILALNSVASAQQYTKGQLLSYLQKVGSQNRIISGQHISGGREESLLGKIRTKHGVWVGVLSTDIAIYLKFNARSNTLLRRVQEHYDAGGIVEMCAHIENVETGGNFRDKLSNQMILVDRSLKPAVYDKYWTLMASYAEWMKKARAKGIPILFRPYHEMNGSWFWWGDQKDGKFADFYKTLWKKTHDFFTVEHGLDNLIWVYSPDGQTRPENALLGWPGDEYVDITGIDFYNSLADPKSRERAAIAWQLLLSKKKPIAFTEVGPAGSQKGKYDYVGDFLAPIKEYFPEAVYFVPWYAPWMRTNNVNAQRLYDDPWVLNRDDLDIDGSRSGGAPRQSP